MTKKLFTLAFSMIILAKSYASSPEGGSTLDFKFRKKGDFYFYWGYNRTWYANSDIHFWGQGHDFMLYNVKGHDRPSSISTVKDALIYVRPDTWSMPQFNVRAGYFINDKYSVSIGWDHMKWVITDNQTVNMYGYIDNTNVADPTIAAQMKETNGGINAKKYNNEQVLLGNNNSSFLQHFEHTDGLNYVSTDLERYDDLWQCKKNPKIGLTIMTGLGGGMVIPRTDAQLFGSGENHFWNVSGWGLHLKAGLQVNLTKRIYLKSDFKWGRIELLNIHTTAYHGIDKAQQNIVFYENYWVIGWRI